MPLGLRRISQVRILRGRWPLVDAAVAHLDTPVLYTLGCHCCEDYAEYVEEEADISVKVTKVEDLSETKVEYGIPEDMDVCRAIDTSDYFVEGDVLMESIGKLAE